MKTELFICRNCGEIMWVRSEYDQDWLECEECGETRELTDKEIDCICRRLKWAEELQNVNIKK